MKPMKSVNVKKSPFLPATESYCELLGYQKIYLDNLPDYSPNSQISNINYLKCYI